jgi:hypothetical protein
MNPNAKYPTDLKYIRFQPRLDSDVDNQKLQAAFEEAYGKEPTEVPIILPTQKLIEFWDMHYVIYGKQVGLLHRCDGINMTHQYSRETKQVVRNPGPCTITHHNEGKYKDAVARLSFYMLPLVQAGFVGVVEFVCKSAYEIRQISNTLTTIEPFVNGNFQGIPAKLYRTEREVKYIGEDGKGHSSRKSLLYMSLDADWFKKTVENMRIGSGATLQLQGGDDDIVEAEATHEEDLEDEGGGFNDADMPDFDADWMY